MTDFCFDDDGRCRDEWDNSFDYCPSCEKYFCNTCCTIYNCVACYNTISCVDCMEDVWCDVEGCYEGPFCSKCAEEETQWLSCCGKIVCKGCGYEGCDCPSGSNSYKGCDWETGHRVEV